MGRAAWTGNGLVLVGRLTVLPEDDAPLVQVGGDFLDDVLRERFGREGEGGPGEFVTVDRVRITVEKLDM